MQPLLDRVVTAAKTALYRRSGEPVRMGTHALRYVPGTRPPRLKYADSPDPTVRNDVKQLQFFLEEVSEGDLVWDVGSNVGQYAVLFAALVGSTGRVVAFEPAAPARLILQRNLALNGFAERVRIEESALFEATGRHTFYSRGANAMASLERAGFGTDENAADIVEITVQTVTVDDYLERSGLSEPHWVKIDAEGSEISILRGAARLLSGKTRMCASCTRMPGTLSVRRFRNCFDWCRTRGERFATSIR